MAEDKNSFADSQAVQFVVTLITYSFYACVIGVSLFPATIFVLWTYRSLIASAEALKPLSVLVFSLSLGGGVFIYFISGIIVMASLIRLISLGIKPGKYPPASLTTFRWLMYSGIYTIAYVSLLPMIPVSFFSNLFFKIVGCKLGKRVYLNSFVLNDAFLIEIEDDVIIGGHTDLSPHIWQDGYLILDRIKVGKGSLIGAYCYLSPGVEVGKRCTIGLGSFIRRGKKIPDDSRYTSLAGLPLRDMARIEKTLARRGE